MLGGYLVNRHQNALGLLDLRSVDGEIGDRGVDGLITPEVAQIDIEALDAGDCAATVAQWLPDDENASGVARGVDDPVPATERLAVAGHRLDQQRDLRRIVGVLV